MKLAAPTLFVLYLLYYSWTKYTAVPDLMGQTSYMVTTGFLVVLTAILPFVLTLFVTRRITGLVVKVGSAILISLSLVTSGLALYFYVFILPNSPDLPIMAVLPRAVIPGLIIGLIVGIGHIITSKNRRIGVR